MTQTILYQYYSFLRKDIYVNTSIIRMLLEEQDEEQKQIAASKDAIFGVRRRLLLRDYSVAVRTELHEARAREKQEKLDAEEQR